MTSNFTLSENINRTMYMFEKMFFQDFDMNVESLPSLSDPHTKISLKKSSFHQYNFIIDIKKSCDLKWKNLFEFSSFLHKHEDTAPEDALNFIYSQFRFSGIKCVEK